MLSQTPDFKNRSIKAVIFLLLLIFSINVINACVLKVTITNPTQNYYENYNLILNLSEFNLSNQNITVCYNINNCSNTLIPFCYLHENWMCNATKSDTIVVKINSTPPNSSTVFFIVTTNNDTATSIANVYADFENFNESSLLQTAWECLSTNYTEAYCQLVNGTYLHIHSVNASKYRVVASRFYVIDARRYAYILFTKAISYNVHDGFLFGFSDGNYMVNYAPPQDDPVNGYYGAIGRYSNSELDIIKSVNAQQTKLVSLHFSLANNSWYYVTFIWNRTRFDLIVKNETNEYHIYGYDSTFDYFDHIFIGGDYADYYFDYVGLLKIPNNVTVSIQYAPPKLNNVTIITKNIYYNNETINATIKLNITVFNPETIELVSYVYDPYSKINISKYTTQINLILGVQEYTVEVYLQPPIRQDYYYLCVNVLNQTFCKKILVINYYYNVSLTLLNNIITAISSLNSTLKYTLSQVNYTNNLILQLNSTINELYNTLLSVNQTTVEKLNEISSNLTTLYLKISDISTYIAQVNQTLYNKLLEIEDKIYELKSNITELINSLEKNLTQQINNLQQNILSSISELNQSILETRQIIVSVNNSINQVINKLNDLYELTVSINGTTEEILNKTITILQQLYHIQTLLSNNFTAINEKLDWLIAKLKNITLKVKPQIMIQCTKDNYVGKPVKCNITVLVLGKPVNLPVEVYIQRTEQTYSISGGIKTKTITVAQFDKVYVINGKATFTFTPTSPGNYTIIVATVQGYYDQDYYYETNYNETVITVKATPIFDIPLSVYNLILLIIVILSIIGLVSLGLRTIFKIITQSISEEFEFARRKK